MLPPLYRFVLHPGAVIYGQTDGYPLLQLNLAMETPPTLDAFPGIPS